ncbi:NAD-dependent epimerase/dehydratase family protein [Andreprevotia chitinilytica]|uniref:NAD-dependent epimerase/dehydratase family protein n=1 Tax=Andreprevotia chitinilytica TaxID=396808 RepID=UPI0005579A24|nr:NAD-dependent epimerase/dehydratase family protein [Andreprevotia chitinilytica]
MSELGNPILVTGAAGYLASWVVDQLLREGHTVHATVRHLNDSQKIQHLQKLVQDFPGKLSLYEADLLKEGSFDRAMAGCSVVIHTASPYFLEKPKNVDKELIQPALHGTLNVLASVNKTESVKRVVLTSSIAALYNDACDVTAAAAHTVQEHDVNPNQDVNHNPYAYSKTIAERAAWDEQKKQSRWDLVSLHPGAMFGPSLSRRVDATSVGMIIQFLNGSFRTGVPKLWLGVVDVRDVAAAHVKAASQPAANNRYIVVGNSLSLLEISKLMRVDEFGIKNKLPKGETSKSLIWLIGPLVGMRRRYVARNVDYPVRFNNSRSKAELGVEYRGAADTFNDHIRQIVADGLLQA